MFHLNAWHVQRMLTYSVNRKCLGTVFVILVIICVIKLLNVESLFQYEPPTILLEDISQHQETTTSLRRRNLTIVSAFFNLGPFLKGDLLQRLFKKPYSSDRYKQWASVLGRIHNPMVFYTDDMDFKLMMEDAREHLSSSTKIVFLSNRTSLWSFGLSNKIKEIYDDPDYPKYQPNTVVPDYACAQHVKFEVVADAINKKIFNTKYYAWLDVGYFREIVDAIGDFVLEVPLDFDDTKVAFNRVESQTMQRTPSDIIRNNMVWVGGGIFFGLPQTLLVLFEDYKRAVLTFLKQKLMNTDQQIIYSMFSEIGRQKVKPKTQLQIYFNETWRWMSFGKNPWFHLGYLCLKQLNSPKQTTRQSG